MGNAQSDARTQKHRDLSIPVDQPPVQLARLEIGPLFQSEDAESSNIQM